MDTAPAGDPPRPVSDLDWRFEYHKPDADKVKRHEAVREACRTLAHVIDDLCPDGRDKSVAIKMCEDAMMWANASIARER
ncbi:MAG TPA: hypothetical protein VF244_02845 [Acidimicrobiales bacterium]